MRRYLTRFMAFMVVLVAFTVVSAHPAGAHADLVDASPSPGSGLAQAPAAVVMRFTEPLNYRLSAITVTGEDGHGVTDGPTEPVDGDRQAMRRKLALLPPGVHTVRWTTVSPLDGHTLKGSYRFAVGTSTPGDEVVRDDPVTSEGLGGIFGRFVAFAGLALWAGAVLLGPRLAPVMPARRLRALTIAGPILAVVGTLGAAISSAMVSAGSIGAAGEVSGSSASGRYRLAVITLGMGAVVWGHRRGIVGVGLVVLAVIADAAAGHAATTAVPALATGVFAAHLFVVGVWVYAIAGALMAGRRLVPVLHALTPYAIVAAGGVGLTGVSAAALALNRPGELLSTGYGQAITTKSALFAVMAILGVGHWLANRRGTLPRWLRVPVTGEAVTAAVAIAVAAVLVGFPDPPRQAETAANRADAATSIEALAGQDTVSVAEASGSFVVALSVLPPRPGPRSQRSVWSRRGGGLPRRGHGLAHDRTRERPGSRPPPPTSRHRPGHHDRRRGCGLPALPPHGMNIPHERPLSTDTSDRAPAGHGQH